MSELVRTVTISSKGELTLPQEVRKAIGVDGEAQLTIRVDAGEIRLYPAADRARKAQDLYAKYVKKDISSDEFLATRERD